MTGLRAYESRYRSIFWLSAQKVTISTDIVAGITTFINMDYVLIVLLEMQVKLN